MSESGVGQSDMDLRGNYKYLDEEERQEKLGDRIQELFQGAELLDSSFDNFSSHD